MIKKLDFTDCHILECAFKIQIEAYEIEALLIGSRNIPPLNETTEDLKKSTDEYFGIFSLDTLVGFIAVEYENNYLRIGKLVVSPSFFKRGAGIQLVRYVLENFRGSQKFLVSTGEENTPARCLYEKLGFFLVRVFEIEGVSIAEYEYAR